MRLLTWFIATCSLVVEFSATETRLHHCTNEIRAEELINSGIDVNSRDSEGKTPLHTCENIDVVQVLLKYRAEVNSRCDQGRTPLHYCKTDTKALHLLNQGAEVNARDRHRKTPLHTCQDRLVAISLLDHGADVNARDDEDKTPLHACNPETVFALLSFGADVNARDKKNQTPLHFCRSTPIAGVLLETGAEVTVISEDGCSALHFAAEADNSSLCELLLEHGSDPNLKNRDGATPLHLAALNSKFGSSVEFLIVDGADVMARMNDGRTPLHTAIEGCRAECAKLLLNNGANVNFADREGKDLWHRAIQCKDLQQGIAIVKMFLDLGADVACKFPDGNTPLHLCVKGRFVYRIVDMLIEGLKQKGLDADILDATGVTPLCAAMSERRDILDVLVKVKYLIDNGSRIDLVYWIDKTVIGELYRRCSPDSLGNAARLIPELRIVGPHIEDLMDKLFSAGLSIGTDSYKPKIVEEYQVEVERLKRSVIHNGISHYDFLHTDNLFVAKSILDNNDIASLPVDFPVYGNLLKGKVKIDAFRADLISSARAHFSTIINNSPRLKKLPEGIVDKILFEFTNFELANFRQFVRTDTIFQILERLRG